MEMLFKNFNRISDSNVTAESAKKEIDYKYHTILISPGKTLQSGCYHYTVTVRKQKGQNKTENRAQ